MSDSFNSSLKDSFNSILLEDCHLKSTITFLSLNARRILPKLDDLRATCTCMCMVHSYDVLKSWLCPEILSSELLIEGYETFHKDRNWHGGGILVYVKYVLFR